MIYLGPQIGAAASVDAATLSYVYGSMPGFIQGARIAEQAGVSVARYGRRRPSSIGPLGTSSTRPGSYRTLLAANSRPLINVRIPDISPAESRST